MGHLGVCHRNTWLMTHFEAASDSGADHDRHVVDGGKHSVKLLHARAVNTVLGKLTMASTGTCHLFDFLNYADQYLDWRSVLSHLLPAACVTKPRSNP